MSEATAQESPDPAGSTFEFDTATAIRRRSDGRYDTDVDAGWTVGDKPNGGYLLATLARAAVAESAAGDGPHADPLAATAHYLRAPDVGPAQIEVSVLRAGRSASQVRSVLFQDDRACVEATFTLGDLPDDDTDAWWAERGPDPVAPREDCLRLPAEREGSPFVVPILDRTDLRLDPACLGWALGQPSGDARFSGWISFADERPIDPLSLLYFLDASPPATFSVVTTGWVPTLSLTTYVRTRPAPGPLRLQHRAQVIHHGFVDEVTELWDSRDRLVAQATQLAGIRIDPETPPHGS